MTLNGCRFWFWIDASTWHSVWNDEVTGHLFGIEKKNEKIKINKNIHFAFTFILIAMNFCFFLPKTYSLLHVLGWKVERYVQGNLKLFVHCWFYEFYSQPFVSLEYFEFCYYLVSFTVALALNSSCAECRFHQLKFFWMCNWFYKSYSACVCVRLLW